MAVSFSTRRMTVINRQMVNSPAEQHSFITKYCEKTTHVKNDVTMRFGRYYDAPFFSHNPLRSLSHAIWQHDAAPQTETRRLSPGSRITLQDLNASLAILGSSCRQGMGMSCAIRLRRLHARWFLRRGNVMALFNANVIL